MGIKQQSIVIGAMSLVTALGLCCCKSGRGLVYDETFRYMCTSRVGPISCGATNMVDALNTLFKEGNESLSSNGCPYGISIVYRPEGMESSVTAASVVLPSCPIHDACMMMARHYNFSYLYQKGMINFFDVPEKGRGGVRCANCEYGLCDYAEIGPFSFNCKSMDEIVREVYVSGNMQLRASGHSVFFLAQLVFEGPIQDGRIFHVKRDRVCNVLLHLAQSLGMKLACDDECFYLYKNEPQIRSLERPVLLRLDSGEEQR